MLKTFRSIALSCFLGLIATLPAQAVSVTLASNELSIATNYPIPAPGSTPATVPVSYSFAGFARFLIVNDSNDTLRGTLFGQQFFAGQLVGQQGPSELVFTVLPNTSSLVSFGVPAPFFLSSGTRNLALGNYTALSGVVASLSSFVNPGQTIASATASRTSNFIVEVPEPSPLPGLLLGGVAIGLAAAFKRRQTVQQ